MKPSYQQPDQQITARRLTRFDAFRATLSDDERACLDAKLARWVKIIKARNIPFSIGYAKELFMALVEMNGFIQGGS